MKLKEDYHLRSTSTSQAFTFERYKTAWWEFVKRKAKISAVMNPK